MAKCREAFEKKFPIPAHWIEFDEKRNKYYCPYAADAKASEYQAMWEVWQSRQAEINQLQSQINEMAEVGLSQEGVIREKDKRIEAVSLILEGLKNAKYMHSLNKAYNAILIEKLEKALRGEYE